MRTYNMFMLYTTTMPLGFGTMMNLIGMQTSCNSGSFMLFKTKLKTMHSNILKKRK
jgi:hypothetical protein